MAIIVPILTQFDDKGIKSAVREFERAKSSLDKFGAVGKIFGEVGQSLTKNVTVPLGIAAAGIYKAVQAASTLQESISKTDAVFAQNAKEIRNWAKGAATAFGQSEQQALEAASSYGNLFQAFGLSRDQATKFSMDITELAADLASFNNTSVDDALLALRSGLSGETEPLKRFGVALNDTRLKEEALRMGLIKTTSGTLPIAIKAQAAYALIMKDTALAQGDFARTSDGLANQQRILSAEVKNITADLGTAFLPIALQVASIIREQIIPQIQKFVNSFKSLSPSTIELGVKIAVLVAALGPLLIVIGKIITATQTFIKVFRALSLALLTNPIYLVVAGLALLAFALYKAWQTSDSFRQGVVKLGNALIWVAEGAVNLFIKYLNVWIKQFNNVIGVLQFFGADIKKIGEIGEVSFKRISVASVEAGNKVTELGTDASDLGATVATQVTPSVDGLGDALEKTGKKSDKAKEQLKKLKEAAKDAAQVVVDNLEESLRKAESALDDIKGKFGDFKNAIGNTITGIMNFGKAAESEDFLKGLADQAVAATAFADKVKKLVVLGLNERGIRQVLDAGFEAGSKIADYIIAGGQTIVTQVNQLTDTVASVADEVGTMGAENFYQAGITQGQAMVDGIKAALEAAKADLQRIIDSMSNASTTTVTNTPSAATANKPTPKPAPSTSKLSTATIQLQNKLKAMNATRFAKGGIVTGPTNALIGEAGPEAVIPLSGANSVGMGSTYNITVNAGIGTDGAVVGRQIVDAIRKYERSSGQVFVRV
jgi:hypothetical protein